MRHRNERKENSLKPHKPPFPLQHIDPIQYTNAWADHNYHPKQKLDQFTHLHNYATKCLLVTWDAPNSPIKTVPFPFLIYVIFILHQKIQKMAKRTFWYQLELSRTRYREL